MQELHRTRQHQCEQECEGHRDECDVPDVEQKPHCARNQHPDRGDLPPRGRCAHANLIEQVFVRFRLVRHCYSSAVTGANNLDHFDTLR